jgi:hypothetical protein
MGTRADFYIGRGPAAYWIGSIAYDGHPGGAPKPLQGVTDETAFFVAVRTILSDESWGVTWARDGWPWPWKNSNTTDYAYAFDEGRVWGTCFGRGWWPMEQEPEDKEDVPKNIQWPSVDAVAAPAKKTGKPIE